MTTKTSPQKRPLRPFTLLAPVLAWLVQWAAQHANRRRLALDSRLLAEMNEHGLSDIGIGRDQIRWLTEPGAARDPRHGL